MSLSSRRVCSPLCRSRRPPTATTTSASDRTTRDCSGCRCSLPGFAAAAAVAARAGASRASRQRPGPRPSDRSAASDGTVAVASAAAAAVATAVAQTAPPGSSPERICRSR